MYDVIIIGAGPAGITASVYAARKSMRFLVITKDIGGQTALSGDIENYTGYQFITGQDLTEKFENHMRTYGINLKENEEALALKKEQNIISVRTAKGEYRAKTVIVASGKKSRELGVPGEAEFKNKGLTYCATCDGPLFAKKDVAIIGGGNSALDAALQLIKIVNRLYIVNIAKEVTGDPVMLEKITGSDKTMIYNSAQVSSVFGKGMVSGIKIKKAGREKTLDVQGVFVEIGLIPNSQFAGMLEKNELGEIKVDSHNRTNIEGIFAAGDVTDVPEKQIIIAAGEGAKAAIGIFKYLSQRKESA